MKYSFLLLSVLLFLSCPTNDKYRVYYYSDSADGDTPQDSNEYYTGETATVLGKGNLVKDDYDFLGWRRYYDEYYIEGEKITIEYEDIYLYAVWDDGSDSLGAFSFKIVNDEAIITRYNERYTSYITIPDTLQGKPVTAIDDNVFSNLSIEEISLSKNLKKIGVASFSSNNLTQLVIPDKVEQIGVGAFRNNKLKKITFGKKISAIEPYTFSKNQLTFVVIPDNIKTIETGAFDGNKIDTIQIGAGVDIISDDSFGDYGKSFKDYYDTDKKAGLYIYKASDDWAYYAP